MSKKPQEDIIKLVDNLDEPAVLAWVHEQMAAGASPHTILDGLSAGLEQVGARFSAGECFIPELILSGNIFKKSLEIVRPALEKSGAKQKKIGTFMIGTVKGDLHDLGKNLVAITFLTAGFEVIDLGKDVSVDEFITAVKKHSPDILGLSALLTTTTEVQRDVVIALKEEKIRDQVKVMVGGAPVNQNWADEIEADAYAADAIDGIRKAKALLGLA